MAQVTDYDVANASGANVRQDLNFILDAIKTCNSGTQNTLGTTSPCQLFADTTNSKLKIRSTSGQDAAASATFFEIGDLDSANLGLLPRSGGSTAPMTGQLLLDDSNSASAPALSFDTDANLGLFRKSADVMGFSSAGEEQAFIDASSLTISSTASNQKELRFLEPINSATNGNVQYVGFKAPDTIAANVVWKLPNADATVDGYALVSDTNGNLRWDVAGAGAQGGGNDNIFWENDQTVTQSYTISNAKNAGSFGPIAIASGVVVTIGSGEVWSVV